MKHTMIYLFFILAIVMLGFSYYKGYIHIYSTLGMLTAFLAVSGLVGAILFLSKLLIKSHPQEGNNDGIVMGVTVLLVISTYLSNAFYLNYKDNCNGGLKEFMNSKNVSLFGGRNLVTDHIENLYLYHNKCESNTGDNKFIYFPREAGDDSIKNYIDDTISGNSKFNLYKTVYNSSPSYQKFKSITQYEWRDRTGVEIYNEGYSYLTGGSLDMLYDIMTDTQKKQYNEMKK